MPQKSVLSLSDQLDKFSEYKNKIKETVGENRMATIISKSIYVLCTGSNDIANTYSLSPVRRAHYDVPEYTDLMASQATNFLQVCSIKRPKEKVNRLQRTNLWSK